MKLIFEITYFGYSTCVFLLLRVSPSASKSVNSRICEIRWVSQRPPLAAAGIELGISWLPVGCSIHCPATPQNLYVVYGVFKVQYGLVWFGC